MAITPPRDRTGDLVPSISFSRRTRRGDHSRRARSTTFWGQRQWPLPCRRAHSPRTRTALIPKPTVQAGATCRLDSDPEMARW